MSSEEQDKTDLPQKNEPELIIPEEVQEIIKDLPEPQRKAVTAIFVGLSIKRQVFRSPIPPPDILKGYNEIIPNGADRILKQSEQQTQHRIQTETTVITRELQQGDRGQHYGFIIAIFGLLLSGFLIYTGHDTAGTILGGTDLIALVSVFVYGKYAQRKDLDSKK